MTSIFTDTTAPKERIVLNSFLVWIDPTIDETTEAFQNALAELRNVVNHTYSFRREDEAIDFLTEMGDVTAFLIINYTMAQHLLPIIHDISHLRKVCVLSSDPFQHDSWTNDWNKIAGVYTGISSICQALQLGTQQCDHDSIAVSFINTDDDVSIVDLNRLDPSFMYTQLFKEILFEMEDDQNSIKTFTDYLRELYRGNQKQLKVIDTFERTYKPNSAVYWYTRQSFIYRLLNQALRTLQGDIIINMAFFIRDLHRQIKQLHSEQLQAYAGQPFTLYRGQFLLKTELERYRKAQGRLMSFNNFLSTTKNEDVPLPFATGDPSTGDLVGVLFRITVDPSNLLTPFASIQKYSQFFDENEVLFSVHSVFRVGEITQTETDQSLFRIDLQLTSDTDGELRVLTQRIKTEILGENGYDKLGQLLIKLQQSDRAEQLYHTLLQQSSDQSQTSLYCHRLGIVKTHQGEHQKANEYAEKALEICRKSLPANHPDLATCYGSMAGVYRDMGEYSKALSFHEKELEIKGKSLPANHPDLATCYGSMAGVYRHMGEYSKALSFHEKELEIVKESLPANHPDLATCYGNMAGVYGDMGEYSKALSFHEKTLQIFKESLPANHPSLATCYGNMAGVYRHMGEYSKALSFHEKELEICRKSLPANHPDLATCYGNMAGVYRHMGEYSKALSFHEKELEICRKSLPANHPSLATCYGNMAGVYRELGEYSKALSFHEKELEICRKSLPANHAHIGIAFNNIASVYRSMKKYSDSFVFLERARDIFQKSLPKDHPYIKSTQMSLEWVAEQV